MRKLHLIHIGIGNVGGTLVDQISAVSEKIKKELDVQLVYSGLFDAKGGVFEKGGLKFSEIPSLREKLRSGDLPDKKINIEDAIAQVPKPFVLIDTTAIEQTIPFMKQALQRGGYVVMSNKKPIAGSQEIFDNLHKLGGERLFYETTVGAGLPVIRPLKTMLEAGDEIVQIQGCFSGTLGFLFSEIEKGLPFSQVVKDARNRRFTEPNPRDDLSGVDVARKALILARIIGEKMELVDIDLNGLYPKEMDSLSREEFMEQLSDLDKEYKEKTVKAKKENKVLRFVATVTHKKCRVGLEAVDRNSDIGNLHGPDNLIVFKTKRYFDNPLVVKGPGAGLAVTAAGVFGDLLEIARIIK